MGRRGNASTEKAGDADEWIKNWEELPLFTSKEILVDVEHVQAHRTETDKQEMTQFEKFVADGKEKADEVAKAGAMFDEGVIHGAGKSKKKVQQEREEMYTALQCAAGWRNGKTVKNSSRTQKKSQLLWTRE